MEKIIDTFTYGGYLVQIFKYVTMDDRRVGYGFHARNDSGSFSGGLSSPDRSSAKQEILIEKAGGVQ